jgi:pimeloyl-ACP methyl ester carboxylesterase
MPDERMTRNIRTAALEIAYEESGPESGIPIILMHGFPDDPRTWDGVASPLAEAGHRVIVPYLRGYGPTRFLDARTPRSGQQAAIGHDLLALIDALAIMDAALVGYDWGGRAACIVAALWPERVRCLVSIGGYDIQNIARAGEPAMPDQEYCFWYQWYFGTERGRAGLAANRGPLCRLLWELWSPNWRFDDATFAVTAASFENPDFVEIVIHSYRHRFGAAAGDPELEAIERRLAAQPPITVPTIVLHGAADGVDPAGGSERHARFFSGPYQRRVVPVAGHFLPREAPEAVIDAVQELIAASSRA